MEGPQVAILEVGVCRAKDDPEQIEKLLLTFRLGALQFLKRSASANTLDRRPGNKGEAEQTVEANARILNEAIRKINGETAFQLRNGYRGPLLERATEKREESA